MSIYVITLDSEWKKTGITLYSVFVAISTCGQSIYARSSSSRILYISICDYAFFIYIRNYAFANDADIYAADQDNE